jgi:hypothetical protein
MNNSSQRVKVLSVLGIFGAIAAIAAILVVGESFGYPGSPQYRIYENFNRVMAIFLAFQICALAGFNLKHGVSLRRVGRAALLLAIFAWIGMVLGTAAEFWLYSDLPYGVANLRSTAFSVFSISSLVAGLALLVLGVDLFLSRALPRYFALMLMIYLAVDIGLWIMGQSIFLTPALASLAFGGMALKGSETSVSLLQMAE